ncbi:MAG: hypothetical protein K0R66_297 [Gammaproteobacteria bacterium]|jgi:Tfp pilus assembly PilM family ATPase|nr:hypothetical protein [Gammaproteobacteria bacterium]
MNYNSIGIDLSENTSKIACLQSCPSHYQLIAQYEIFNADTSPSEHIENLIAGLAKNLSALKIKNLPTFLALSKSLAHQQRIQIEGDILRLRPYAVDQYIFERALDWIERPLKDLYLDYVVLESVDAEFTEVLIAWAEKAKLKAYLSKLKQLKIKLKAIELADMARKRFDHRKPKLHDPDRFINLGVAYGAALREWDETA